jgi:hypothetical protein
LAQLACKLLKGEIFSFSHSAGPRHLLWPKPWFAFAAAAAAAYGMCSYLGTCFLAIPQPLKPATCNHIRAQGCLATEPFVYSAGLQLPLHSTDTCSIMVKQSNADVPITSCAAVHQLATKTKKQQGPLKY